MMCFFFLCSTVPRPKLLLQRDLPPSLRLHVLLLNILRTLPLLRLCLLWQPRSKRFMRPCLPKSPRRSPFLPSPIQPNKLLHLLLPLQVRLVSNRIHEAKHFSNSLRQSPSRLNKKKSNDSESIYNNLLLVLLPPMRHQLHPLLPQRLQRHHHLPQSLLKNK